MIPKFESYVICTSPRSGSTLLIKLLAATGVAGNPSSLFHSPTLDGWLNHFDLKPGTSSPERDVLAMIFRAALKEGSRDTGMFGLRLQRHSFDFFVEKLAVIHPDIPNDRARIETTFGRTLFIHLTRQDKVAQAVSYMKAEQSGLWHVAPDGKELERIGSPNKPSYNGANLKANYDQFTVYDRDWNTWFESQSIQPFRITYDSLSSDPNGILGDVLEKLGLDTGAAEGIVPGTAKLSDANSQEWSTRFRAEYDII
ncbi:MAG: Stf0 family sulfotransferase [Roseibium sp.]